MSESIMSFEDKHMLHDPEVSRSIYDEFELLRKTVNESRDEENAFRYSIRLPSPVEGAPTLILNWDTSILPNSIISRYELFEGIGIDGPTSEHEDMITGRPLLSVLTVQNNQEEEHVMVDYYTQDPHTVMDKFRQSVRRSSKIQIDTWAKE